MSVFLAGHALRNRVYHADYQNPAALPLIAMAYAQAVGRAFVRSQVWGIASTAPDRLFDDLREYGYQSSSELFGSRIFSPIEAARAVAERLLNVSEARVVSPPKRVRSLDWAGRGVNYGSTRPTEIGRNDALNIWQRSRLLCDRAVVPEIR